MLFTARSLAPTLSAFNKYLIKINSIYPAALPRYSVGSALKALPAVKIRDTAMFILS